MALTNFPDSCRALIVEHEPVQAFALECILGEFDCRAVGPVSSVAGIEDLVESERPNFALVEANLPEANLVPLAACLDKHEVPFALLTVGSGCHVPDRVEVLQHRPRLDRPFHPPSLHAAASALYRTDLRNRVISADQQIEWGRLRLARQLRLIERLAAAGRDTTTADALAREFGRLLQTMRASRRILAAQLEHYAD
jgi:DNA-binding response OmpR family regulator